MARKKATKKTSDNRKHALLSVYDKKGIVEFAKSLTELGFEIISTGGTAKVLNDNKIPVIPIQKITGNPECFDGRMKTISFEIESGILYDRGKKSHVKEAKDLNIKPIDIVVCNLYPFENAVSKKSVSLDTAIENIDIGGPVMVRAAAKNFKNVLVVIDPNDYQKITDSLKEKKIDLRFRQELAVKAFAHTAFYDSQIAKHFGKDMFLDEVTLAGRKSFELKYGENPHQKASFYIEPNTSSLMGKLKSLSDKIPSLINIVDINAGIKAVELFSEPCAVVIKHHTPCGIAAGKNTSEALERAIEADPESAFGGVIVINNPIDLKTAKIIASFKEEKKKNIDVIVCPSIEKKALTLLKSVRKNMGIYVFGKMTKKNSDNKNIKFVDGGFLLQTADNDVEKNFSKWEIVTKKKPTKKQLEQMKAAWKFVSRIKSNSVIIVDEKLPMTRGIGSGQTSRFRSTKLALEQAGKFVKGGILASDSFFPFDDSVKLAAKHEVSAIIQQGDSVNDKLSIEAADKANIPMVLTHTRAFWH